MPTILPECDALGRQSCDIFEPRASAGFEPCDSSTQAQLVRNSGNFDDASFEAPTFPALIDLLLKDQPRLDQIARDPRLQQDLIPRFLAIGVVGYTIFGVGLAIVLNASGLWPQLHSVSGWLSGDASSLIRFAPASAAEAWLGGSALALIAAFTLGLIGTIGVCLPSFYFYGLLAGVRTTMLQVTVHATKGMASAAIAVIGVLPIYLALVLGTLVFGLPAAAVRAQCLLGMLLPFIAGLWGTRSLYVGFVGLSDTLPPERRCRRGCFLRRLMISWCLCFTAVTPVMIFTLWEYFERLAG